MSFPDPAVLAGLLIRILEARAAFTVAAARFDTNRADDAAKQVKQRRQAASNCYGAQMHYYFAAHPVNDKHTRAVSSSYKIVVMRTLLARLASRPELSITAIIGFELVAQPDAFDHLLGHTRATPRRR